MPHSLLMFFLPDSTAFLIAENLFFHHAGRILLDDLIEGLKIGYLVLEVLVLFSQRLVLLLQILSAYFPWHRFLWVDGNSGLACFRTIRSPSLISIMLCKDVVFTPEAPVFHARAWQTMLICDCTDALPVLIFKNALHPEFLCVVVVFPSHILLLPLPSSGAEQWSSVPGSA